MEGFLVRCIGMIFVFNDATKGDEECGQMFKDGGMSTCAYIHVFVNFCTVLWVLPHEYYFTVGFLIHIKLMIFVM